MQHQPAFGLDLMDEAIERLADYYDLIQQNNQFLHLVAPMPAEEFAIRHILESLTLLEYLPLNVKFADIGAGAGLPAIPCLLVRDDLRAILIDSKEKKTGFLQKVLAKCEINGHSEVINRQFAEVKKGDTSYITCRALDRFTQKLPQILKWSGNCTLLLFGGPNLRAGLRENRVMVMEKRMPMSDQRFLFVSAKD